MPVVWGDGSGFWTSLDFPRGDNNNWAEGGTSQTWTGNFPNATGNQAPPPFQPSQTTPMVYTETGGAFASAQAYGQQVYQSSGTVYVETGGAFLWMQASAQDAKASVETGGASLWGQGFAQDAKLSVEAGGAFGWSQTYGQDAINKVESGGAFMSRQAYGLDALLFAEIGGVNGLVTAAGTDAWSIARVGGGLGSIVGGGQTGTQPSPPSEPGEAKPILIVGWTAMGVSVTSIANESEEEAFMVMSA